MGKYEDDILEEYIDDEETLNEIEAENEDNEISNPEKEELINKLAIRLSYLNQEMKKGNANTSTMKEIKKLRKKIMAEVFSLYKKSYNRNCEKHRGIYITDMITINRKGDKISAEKFYDFLYKSLNADSASCYNADKNNKQIKYITYFRNIIKKRSKDSKEVSERNKAKEKILNTVPIYAKDEDGEEHLITDTKEISERYERPLEEGYIKLFVPVMRLCEISIRNCNRTKKWKTQTWLFFRTLYTFDIVKEIERIKTSYIPPDKRLKGDNEHENITSESLEQYITYNREFAIFKKRNHEIYRNMRLTLVEILKEGSTKDFNNMLDIIRRKLRMGIDLNKRPEYVAKDLEVSVPTVNRYTKLYKEEILKAVYSDQLSY